MKVFEWNEKNNKLFDIFKKYKYVLIVILAGIVLLIMPFGSKAKTENPSAAVSGAESFSVEQTEKKIEQALSRIEGVGEVTFVLTVKSGTQQILAQDETLTYQKSGEGEEEECDLDREISTVILSRGSGMEEAIVTKSLYPEFQGALVVCTGAGNAGVRLRVTEAVSALTGLGADKISVTKMKQ